MWEDKKEIAEHHEIWHFNWLGDTKLHAVETEYK